MCFCVWIEIEPVDVGFGRGTAGECNDLTVSYYGLIPCTISLRVSTGFDIDDKPVMGYLLVC